MSAGDPDPKWLNENTCGKFRMFKPKEFTKASHEDELRLVVYEVKEEIKKLRYIATHACFTTYFTIEECRGLDCDICRECIKFTELKRRTGQEPEPIKLV